MSTGAITGSMITTAHANDPFVLPDYENMPQPRRRGRQLSDEQLVDLVSIRDRDLKAIADYEAHKQYQQDPTRKVTSVIGNSIPFVDSYMVGALTKGSASTKIAAAGGRAADWGVFTGAVWLWNKALGKVYQNSSSAREFKREHPTVTFVGEVGTAYLAGIGAIKGFNWSVDKLTKGKGLTGVIAESLEKRPKLAEGIGKIFKPVANFAEKHPVVMRYTGLAVGVTLIGLIAKNIFDVHHTKKTADKRYEQLKDQRHEATVELLNRVAEG